MRPRSSRVTRRASWLLPVVLAMEALSGGVALADEPERTMALVEIRATEQANPLTADYLQDVLVGLQKEVHGDVLLVSMAKSAEKLRMDRDQVPSSVQGQGRLDLEAARKLGAKYLDDADAPSAIRALQAAEAKYRAAVAAQGADERLRQDYLDVLAQLATAHVIANDTDAATEVFRTVVTAYGAKANVTDDNYRPDVVELFRKVAKEVSTRPKGQLEVTSEPPGAHMLINGIDRGVTPATVSDLAQGVYTVRLQVGSANSLLHRVKVSGEKKAMLSIHVEFERHVLLDEGRVGLGYPDLDAAQRRVLLDSVELGKELGVASVAAVGVLDGMLYAWLVDVAHARVDRSCNLKIPSVGASPRAVARVLNTLLGERKGAEGESDGSAKPAAAWYTSVPGWACGVAALAAFGLGAAYAANFDAGEVTVNSQDAKDKMQTGRVIGGLSLGAGALLAGAAGYFFWQQAQTPPESKQEGASSGWNALPPPQLGFAPTTFANFSGR